ncbi:hypothetical protein AAVH_28589 [Aphelenchoides avenae]|nr:hypothetical protein AAVH_28589 [Aphelenchus avenae]
MSRKRRQAASKYSGNAKKAKPGNVKNLIAKARTRSGLLTLGEFLDVFDCLQRQAIDDVCIASRICDTTARRAQPLREMRSVSLFKHEKTGIFKLNFTKDEWNGKPWRSSKDFAKCIAMFFGYLRFCWISASLQITGIAVGTDFVDHLKDMQKQIRCVDTRVYLNSVIFLDSVKPMDLLCAFPSWAPLDSLSVIRGTVELNDAFLQTLASHGMWRNRANMEGQFTDESIVDYAFGDYEDDGRQRVLSVTSSEITSSLVQKLAKAFHECEGTHSIHMKVHSRQMLDISGLEAGGRKDLDDNGATIWHFTLPGPGDSEPLDIEYTQPTSARNGRLVWRRGESKLLVWDVDTDLDFT